MPKAVSVPELAIDDPLFIVTVPAEETKLPPLLTVRAEATVKLLAVVTPVPLIVRFP